LLVLQLSCLTGLGARPSMTEEYKSECYHIHSISIFIFIFIFISILLILKNGNLSPSNFHGSVIPSHLALSSPHLTSTIHMFIIQIQNCISNLKTIHFKSNRGYISISAHLTMTLILIFFLRGH
jgi:hypothetical protein